MNNAKKHDIIEDVKSKPKLTQKIITIFGLSELVAMIVAQISTSYYAYYITNVLLVAPAVMGTILIFTRVFDIGSLLLSGVVEEKANPRWGKYRSWLVLVCPIAMIIGIIQYSSIGASQTQKLIISAICYIIFHALFNFGRTAQMALLNALGSTARERATLSARKAQFSAVSGIVLNALFMTLVLFFSGNAQTATSKGFLITVFIFQVVYLIPQLSLFRNSKEFDYPQNYEEVTANKLTLKEMAEQVVKNKPLILMLIAETCKTLFNVLVNSMGVYYFAVVVNNLTQQPIFATSLSIAGFVGTIVAGQFTMRLLGKKKTYLIGFAGPAVLLVLARIFGGNNQLVFIGLMTIAYFFFTNIATPGPAMFADCVEYGKFKIGKEARAFVMSLYTLPIKIGVLLAGGLSGYMLAAIGYSAEAEVTSSISSGIFSAVTLAPAAVLTVGFVCILFYNLTESKVQEIMKINRDKEGTVMPAERQL